MERGSVAVAAAEAACVAPLVVVAGAAPWAAVAAALGRWDIAAGLMAVRMATAVAGTAGLRDWRSLLLVWAVIPRDLFGVAIWIAGLFGDTVVWRGRVLRLDREGRIIVQKS